MLTVFLLLLPIGLAFFLVGVKIWRTTIVAMFVWLLLEGAVRKWVFPQFQAPILLMKDAGFLAAYVGYMLSPKHRVPEEDKVKALALWATILTIYCVLEVLNPNLPTPLLAIYGLKNYLMYIPLIFILPEMIRTRQDLNKMIFWICVISVPICLLALYQFTQPGTSWVNKYVSHEAGQEVTASLFGEQGEGEFRYGRARTSSTFSYIGGFTTFLLLIMPLCGALLLASRERSRETMVVMTALLFAIGATFTTGSRTPVFAVIAVAPIMTMIAGGKGLLPLSAAMRLAAATAIIGAIGYYLFADAAEALMYRTQNTDSIFDRFLTPVVDTVGAYQTSPLFGLGIGSNSNAAPTLGGADQYWLQGNYFELEPARVMQDLGIGGFVLVYFMKVYVIFLVIRYLSWSRSKLFVALQMAILAFVVPHLVLFTINNPTGGVLYWGMVGLSIAVHRIERRERRVMEARALAAQQPHLQPQPPHQPPQHPAIA
jgi:hypothetical protein